jgi:hypothetical protein
MTVNSEVNFKKNEIEYQQNNIPKLEIIEEETNKYVEDLKKGTYNILVFIK